MLMVDFQCDHSHISFGIYKAIEWKTVLVIGHDDCEHKPDQIDKSTRIKRI